MPLAMTSWHCHYSTNCFTGSLIDFTKSEKGHFTRRHSTLLSRCYLLIREASKNLGKTKGKGVF